jgi:hypothetical protein
VKYTNPSAGKSLEYFASPCVQHLYSFFDPLAGAAKKYRESLSVEQVDKLELRFLKHVMQVSSAS